MAISKFQNYDTEVIQRDQIKNAPYNPRIMDKNAQKRLKENIKKHGLVSALTWNKRTGNLVGGHQRIEQLDALEKNEDYELTVCVVDVDEKEEATLNVQLNNPSMQGDWDLDKLAEITEDFDLSMTDDLGFTKSDVDFMFDGDERFSELFDTPEANETKEKIDEVRNARSKSVDNLKERNNINWYAIIVFEDEKDRDSFFKEISVPKYEQYITAEHIRRLYGHTD
jgi:hypothetical protein